MQKASNQLNAIGRIQNLLGKKEKETLINSFVYANFNYCPLVWNFCSAKSVEKIEKIQKRALRILLNDYESNYETLLIKSNKCSMQVKRMQTLGIEIFKTLNSLNPEYMKDIFCRSEYLTHKPLNLKVNNRHTVKYGDKSMRNLGPHIWNSLPDHIKAETDIFKFKNYINQWLGPKCKCSLCSQV